MTDAFGLSDMAGIRARRGVPARRGMKVEVDGKEGVISSARGGYLQVRFADARVLPCHPTWRVRYFDDNGEVLLDTTEPTSP